MSYLALYRKYRPSKFEDLAGQNYIVEILKRSIKNNKISHAYLFSGPRGTGKTSIAKLIAKLINCENPVDLNPCNSCKSCNLFNEKNNPDIIEIDAASNNGVDEIREIRDKVSLMPSVSNYKVYIIDEVHMLSSGAFNALLKTLEEPPKHVIFILATTEFYKVPETIVSRCQCFEFERICDEDIVKRLTQIVELENINIDRNVLSLIAKYSYGGMRDAIGMLDKLSCYSNNITIDDFYELRGLISKDKLFELFNDIYNCELEKALEVYNNIVNKGKNISLLMNDMLEFVKDLIINSLKGENNLYQTNVLYNYVSLIEDTLGKLKFSSNQKILAEICVLKMIEVNKNEEKNISQEIKIENNGVDDTKKVSNEDENVNILSNDKLNDENSVNEFTKDKPVFDYLEKQRVRINNTFALANKNLLDSLKSKWNGFNDYLHNKEFVGVVSYLLDGNLRVAGDKDVIISVTYDTIVNSALQNLNKIEILFNLVQGKYYNIVFITDEDWINLRNQFVQDKKNGKVYNYMEEKLENDDIINNDITVKEDSSSVIDAINLFGNDVVEIK